METTVYTPGATTKCTAQVLPIVLPAVHSFLATCTAFFVLHCVSKYRHQGYSVGVSGMFVVSQSRSEVQTQQRYYTVGANIPLSLLTRAGFSLQVYLCARSWQNPAWATETVPFGHQHNIWRRPVPTSLAKDGSVTFSDGQRVEQVDSVMYCTGYLYTFPFLENIVSTADNR